MAIDWSAAGVNWQVGEDGIFKHKREPVQADGQVVAYVGYLEPLNPRPELPQREFYFFDVEMNELGFLEVQSDRQVRFQMYNFSPPKGAAAHYIADEQKADVVPRSWVDHIKAIAQVAAEIPGVGPTAVLWGVNLLRFFPNTLYLKAKSDRDSLITGSIMGCIGESEGNEALEIERRLAAGTAKGGGGSTPQPPSQ